MKIIIDLRMYGPEQGGLGRYNQKLLEQLIKIDEHNHYILLMRNHPDLSLPKNFQVKICNIPWYSLAEQLYLPVLLTSLRPDLVHFTHFNVPIFYRGKFIVTIHDLIMTKFPSRRASTLGKLSFIFKRLGYSATIKSAVVRASKIIAVSKFTAQDITSFFKLTPAQAQKIKVIYEGVSQVTLPEPSDLELPAKYFLYVGNVYPHKNVEFLVKGFKEFLKSNPEYYLLIVGSRNYFYNRLEAWAYDFLGEQKQRVIFTGFVPDTELAHYYRQAQAYVFPSLYEGFGLPPLEAMTFDLPVLSSSSSCLPEVLGEAALYFDPTNSNDLLYKLDIIVSSQQIRTALINKARIRLLQFSWQACARETLALYESK